MRVAIIPVDTSTQSNAQIADGVQVTHGTPGNSTPRTAFSSDGAATAPRMANGARVPSDQKYEADTKNGATDAQ